MRNFLCSIAMLIISTVTSVAYAGTVTAAKVTTVRVDRTGFGYAEFSVQISGRPSCANSWPSTMSFDTSQAGGKSLLSLFESAILAGRSVAVYGANVCTQYGVMEAVDYALLGSD